MMPFDNSVAPAPAGPLISGFSACCRYVNGGLAELADRSDSHRIGAAFGATPSNMPRALRDASNTDVLAC